MKNTSKLDTALKAAFDGYRQDWCAALPEGGAVTLTPTANAKMQKALRRAKVYYPLFGTTARRVASVVLALFIAFNAVVLNVESLLPGKASLTVEDLTYHRYRVTVTYKGEIPAYDFEEKYPSYLPQGYSMGDATGSIFQNEVGVSYIGPEDYFIYTQSSFYHKYLDGDPIEYIISADGKKPKQTVIDGKRAVIATRDTSTCLIICDNQYVYFLSGSGNIPLSEYKKIAESIS